MCESYGVINEPYGFIRGSYDVIRASYDFIRETIRDSYDSQRGHTIPK